MQFVISFPIDSNASLVTEDGLCSSPLFNVWLVQFCSDLASPAVIELARLAEAAAEVFQMISWRECQEKSFLPETRGRKTIKEQS